VRLTFNDVFVPPRTDAGVKTTLAGAGGSTLITVDADVPARVAVTLTAVSAVTYAVLIPTFTLRAPVGTAVVLVVIGTPSDNPKPRAGLSEVTVKTQDAGAGPSSITVAVPVLDPVIDAGFDTTETTTGAVMVMSLLRTTPRALAVTVTGVATAAGTVVAVNVASVIPSAMVTVAGTTTLVLDDDNVTVKPPAGAVPSILTVPATSFPPAVLIFDKPKDVMFAAFTVTLLVLEEPFS